MNKCSYIGIQNEHTYRMAENTGKGIEFGGLVDEQPVRHI